MRKSRFTEEQIVAALQLAKSGGDVGEICRKLSITHDHFLPLEGGVRRARPDEAKRLKQLEDENRRLMKIVADQTAGTTMARSRSGGQYSRALGSSEPMQSRAVGWWALQDSNLRPLPCESPQGSRQTYTSLVKSSPSLEMPEPSNSDLRHDLAPFFTQLGPNWVQCWSSKHFSARGSKKALLCVRQVAQLLGLSTASVYRLCDRGDLQHFRISNAIRLSVDDLAAFLEAQRARH